jgi:hypothetical protein
LHLSVKQYSSSDYAWGASAVSLLLPTPTKQTRSATPTIMQRDDGIWSRPTFGQEEGADTGLSFWTAGSHPQDTPPLSPSPFNLSAPFILGPPVSMPTNGGPVSPALDSEIPALLDSPMPPNSSPPNAPKLGSSSTPPRAPRAPTFDSPSRFTQTSNSYPSPIQAGFRTPVSKASSSRRSVSSAKVARALTFGDDEQAGFSPLSYDARIAGFTSPPAIEKKSSFKSLSSAGKREAFGSSNERESSDDRDLLSRGHAADRQNVLRSWAEEREDEFDGRPPALMSTGIMALQSDSHLQRVPSSSTLGGGRGQIEVDSVFQTRAPSPPRERPTPAPVSTQPLQGEFINMGDGLAGGPQRDARGKKINVDKWRRADPLSAPLESGNGKDLGGFKKRFSASLMSLVGHTKQADAGSSGNPKRSSGEGQDLTPGSRARKLFFRRSSAAKDLEPEQPPQVPARTSSYKNQSFLRNRAQRQSSHTKPLPYSPSMPILSESLQRDTPNDDRIIAWLSTTSLNLESMDTQNRQRRPKAALGFPDDRMNWSAARSRPVPTKLQGNPNANDPSMTNIESRPISMALFSKPAIESPSASLPSRASTPVAEDGQIPVKKTRPRSLARLSLLFRRSNSSKTSLVSPVKSPQRLNTGDAYQFPPIESRRQSDSSQAGLPKAQRSPHEGEPLDAPGSRWQSRRSSGDWRKLLQSSSTVLRPEEADHFASIVSGPSPTIPSLSRSSTPAFEASQPSVSLEDDQPKVAMPDFPVLRSPLDKSFSLLSEVIEEEDHANMTATTVRAGPMTTSVGVQTDPLACSHCSTVERAPSGRYLSGRPMSRNGEKHRHQRHSHRASASSTLLSEVTEASAVADNDVRIRTILSSPVHSVPPSSSRTSYILVNAEQGFDNEPTPSQTPIPAELESRRLSLAFPMPPGTKTV